MSAFSPFFHASLPGALAGATLSAPADPATPSPARDATLPCGADAVPARAAPCPLWRRWLHTLLSPLSGPSSGC